MINGLHSYKHGLELVDVGGLGGLFGGLGGLGGFGGD